MNDDNKIKFELVNPQMDAHGKMIGLVVFIMGITMLFFVLYTAFGMIDTLSMPSTSLSSGGAESGDPLGGISGTLDSMAETSAYYGYVFMKIGLLYVMAYCASWIAGRGVQMYRASKLVPEMMKSK